MCESEGERARERLRVAKEPKKNVLQCGGVCRSALEVDGGCWRVLGV